MKCPKCKRDMKRVKEETNSYYYVCTNCNYQIGKRGESDGRKKEGGQT